MNKTIKKLVKKTPFEQTLDFSYTCYLQRMCTLKEYKRAELKIGLRAMQYILKNNMLLF